MVVGMKVMHLRNVQDGTRFAVLGIEDCKEELNGDLVKSIQATIKLLVL